MPVTNRCWFMADDNITMPYASEAHAFVFAIEIVENRAYLFHLVIVKLLQQNMIGVSCIRQLVKTTE